MNSIYILWNTVFETVLDRNFIFSRYLKDRLCYAAFNFRIFVPGHDEPNGKGSSHTRIPLDSNTYFSSSLRAASSKNFGDRKPDLNFVQSFHKQWSGFHFPVTPIDSCNTYWLITLPLGTLLPRWSSVLKRFHNSASY